MNAQMFYPYTKELERHVLMNTPNILIMDGYDIGGCEYPNMLYVRFVYRPKNAPTRFMESFMNRVLLDEPVMFMQLVLDEFKSFKEDSDQYEDLYSRMPKLTAKDLIELQGSISEDYPKSVSLEKWRSWSVENYPELKESFSKARKK